MRESEHRTQKDRIVVQLINRYLSGRSSRFSFPDAVDVPWKKWTRDLKKTVSFFPTARYDFRFHQRKPNPFKQLSETWLCDEAWLVDDTYLLTESGWMHGATVMDRHSRCILDWSASVEQPNTNLILKALKAVATPLKASPKGIAHHPERDSTYAS